MSSSPQEIVALLIVLIAAGYMLRRVWLIATKRQAGGCGSGGCSQCPAGGAKETPAPTFIPVEQLRKKVSGE